MQTLKSNWLGSKNSSPVIYRASSNGNVFSRTEKLNIIFAERANQKRKASRQELILKERNKAKAESASRSRFFSGVQKLVENPDAKIRHSKNSVYIQPRVNGTFGKKVEL